MGSVIEVDNLKKHYGSRVAVEDVSFQVRQGEIFGLLGRNGAGKTTTVECLQGLRRADGGRVRVLGLDPQRQTQQLRRRIGCQLQEAALPDRLKVWEALDLFASLAPAGPDWRVLMDQWGLTDKRTASFAGLSGGQRQRLFVALALVNDPEVVFLDELTQGLDPAARRVAWGLIGAIRDRGATVVLVTHYMDEAEQLCDRLVVMDKGRIVAEGSPRELIERYSTREVVELRFDDGHRPDDFGYWTEGLVSRVESLPDRVLLYTDDGDAASHGIHERGLTPESILVRRSTLEDVFLHLTGRSLVE